MPFSSTFQNKAAEGSKWIGWALTKVEHYTAIADKSSNPAGKEREGNKEGEGSETYSETSCLGEGNAARFVRDPPRRSEGRLQEAGSEETARSEQKSSNIADLGEEVEELRFVEAIADGETARIEQEGSNFAEAEETAKVE